MIRSLAADELPWFLSQAFAFLGHNDPRGLAFKTVKLLKDDDLEADHCFVLIENKQALAGVHVIAPDEDDDDQNLHIVYPWFSQDKNDLERLFRQVLARLKYEALHFPLYNIHEDAFDKLEPVFRALKFELEQMHDYRFELADLPPLGLPLVLEAWSWDADELFEATFVEAEGLALSESYWAWLKRWRGPFQPDLWFLARESIDQDVIGYGFFGCTKQGIDGQYYLTAIGAHADYRHSSEMLRRLLLSTMRELASRSPLGRLETSLNNKDPKLNQILESLGFELLNSYRVLIKRPS